MTIPPPRRKKTWQKYDFLETMQFLFGTFPSIVKNKRVIQVTCFKCFTLYNFELTKFHKLFLKIFCRAVNVFAFSVQEPLEHNKDHVNICHYWTFIIFVLSNSSDTTAPHEDENDYGKKDPRWIRKIQNNFVTENKATAKLDI